jgi:putative transcriptional regulator
MTNTTRPKSKARLDAAIVEMAQDGLLSRELADKITLRVLGEKAPARPEGLSPSEIRKLRAKAGMSQAVFARYLNLTTGYLSELERGAKRPSGAALALLHVIRRKGIEVML